MSMESRETSRPEPADPYAAVPQSLDVTASRRRAALASAALVSVVALMLVGLGLTLAAARTPVPPLLIFFLGLSAGACLATSLREWLQIYGTRRAGSQPAS